MANKKRVNKKAKWKKIREREGKGKPLHLLHDSNLNTELERLEGKNENKIKRF